MRHSRTVLCCSWNLSNPSNACRQEQIRVEKVATALAKAVQSALNVCGRCIRTKLVQPSLRGRAREPSEADGIREGGLASSRGADAKCRHGLGKFAMCP